MNRPPSLTILNSSKVKIIIKRLKNQFGIEKIKFLNQYIILKNNKKKLFLSTKSEKNYKINIPKMEKVGLYFGRINKDETIRLSLEGSQIIDEFATKNIMQLDHNQAENWLKGFDFDIPKVDDGYYILKYKEDVLGCGLIKINKLYNFLPKNRRLKVLYD